MLRNTLLYLSNQPRVFRFVDASGDDDRAGGQRRAQRSRQSRGAPSVTVNPYACGAGFHCRFGETLGLFGVCADPQKHRTMAPGGSDAVRLDAEERGVALEPLNDSPNGCGVVSCDTNADGNAARDSVEVRGDRIGTDDHLARLRRDRAGFQVNLPRQWPFTGTLGDRTDLDEPCTETAERTERLTRWIDHGAESDRPG